VAATIGTLILGADCKLDNTPPDLASPDNPSADRAVVKTYEADRIRLETATGASGLLILIEAYYPA
jgi:hypothetical protein